MTMRGFFTFTIGITIALCCLLDVTHAGQRIDVTFCENADGLDIINTSDSNMATVTIRSPNYVDWSQFVNNTDGRITCAVRITGLRNMTWITLRQGTNSPLISESCVSGLSIGGDLNNKELCLPRIGTLLDQHDFTLTLALDNVTNQDFVLELAVYPLFPLIMSDDTISAETYPEGVVSNTPVISYGNISSENASSDHSRTFISLMNLETTHVTASIMIYVINITLHGSNICPQLFGHTDNISNPMMTLSIKSPTQDGYYCADGWTETGFTGYFAIDKVFTVFLVDKSVMKEEPGPPPTVILRYAVHHCEENLPYVIALQRENQTGISGQSSVFVIECDEGYENLGPSFYVCTKDVWKPQKPVCTRSPLLDIMHTQKPEPGHIEDNQKAGAPIFLMPVIFTAAGLVMLVIIALVAIMYRKRSKRTVPASVRKAEHTQKSTATRTTPSETVTTDEVRYVTHPKMASSVL